MIVKAVFLVHISCLYNLAIFVRLSRSEWRLTGLQFRCTVDSVLVHGASLFEKGFLRDYFLGVHWFDGQEGLVLCGYC